MPLKLFDRGRRSLDSHLRQNEEITAINRFGSTIFAGTTYGCLLILATSRGDCGQWEEEAKLQLSEESSRKSKIPISQICCASALDLIIALHGEEMIGIQLGEELQIDKLLDKAKRIVLNSNATIDDPFSVQLAVTHSHKPVITIGQISAEDTARFRKEQKVVTQGCVLECAYSGNSLCYAAAIDEKSGASNAATSVAYFVHDLQTKNGSNPIRLFDATQQQNFHVIYAVGMEEFCMTGVHGLLMFVNGQGVSTRPPISLPGEFAPVGLTLKEPFYYMLDSSGMLFVFSTMDGQLKQCLDFPSDENEANHIHQSVTTRRFYQLANLDGQIFVVPPAGHCLFELVSMEIFDQIDDHIQLGHLDTALAMMEENSAQICTSSRSEEQTTMLQMRQFQKEIAFRFLQRGEFEKGFSLLAQSEADPRLLLSVIGKQCPELELSLANRDLSILPMKDENFPEIPLAFVEEYLQGILRTSTTTMSPIDIQLLESSLARTSTMLGKFPPTKYLVADGVWNDQQFRQWMAERSQQPMRAAKLASEIAGGLPEAFTRWREIAEGNGGKLMGEASEDCLQALTKIRSASLLESILPWLAPIESKLCMEAIENLEANSAEEIVRPEIVLKYFDGIQPNLLYSYLDKRIHSLNSPICHNKMLDLYIEFLQNGGGKKDEEKMRQKLRNFLIFSRQYDRPRAQHFFGQEKHENFFIIEWTLAKANEECAVDCLRELTSTLGIDAEDKANDREERMNAAEMLCTHYQSPEMLKTLLTVHLRLSGSNPILQLQIPRLLSLFQNDVDAAEVLQNLSGSLSSAPLIQNFLSRHFANRLGTREWQKMHAKLAELEAEKLRQELTEKRTKTSFRMEEGSACTICGRTLSGKGAEEFARNPQNGQLIHLRCHRARKEKI